MSKVISLWNTLTADVWIVTEPYGVHVMLVDEDENLAVIRCFPNEHQANLFKRDMIELDLYRPSELTVSKISLKEIFALRPEFEAFAKEVYDLPVKISLTHSDNDDGFVEDTLYQTAVENN
jgi:hypothetical protein